MGQRCRGNAEEIFRGKYACLEKAGVKGFVDLTYMTKSRVTNPTKSRVPQGNHRIVDVTAARAADQGGGKQRVTRQPDQRKKRPPGPYPYWA
jgi:hypothetical protein